MLQLGLVLVLVPALALSQSAASGSAVAQLLQGLSVSSAGRVLAAAWNSSSSEPCSGEPWIGLVCDAASASVVSVRLQNLGLEGDVLDLFPAAFPALVNL
jgi:hypothetical protein